MKTITQITNVYEFSELSDKAKAKARDWYREGNTDDGFGAECVIDDAKRVFALCGITIDRVGYSGFWSQGDGAHFEGSWRASDVKVGGVKDEAPVDETLHSIAAEFERLAALFRWHPSARSTPGTISTKIARNSLSLSPTKTATKQTHRARRKRKRI